MKNELVKAWVRKLMTNCSPMFSCTSSPGSVNVDRSANNYSSLSFYLLKIIIPNTQFLCQIASEKKLSQIQNHHGETLLCSEFLQLFLIFLDLLLGREEMWISLLLFRHRGEDFWRESPTLTFCSLEETLCGLETWEVDVMPAAPARSVPSCPPASCPAGRRCRCSSEVPSSTGWAFPYSLTKHFLYWNHLEISVFSPFTDLKGEWAEELPVEVEKEQRRFWSDGPPKPCRPRGASSLPTVSPLPPGSLVLEAPIAVSWIELRGPAQNF